MLGIPSWGGGLMGVCALSLAPGPFRRPDRISSKLLSELGSFIVAAADARAERGASPREASARKVDRLASEALRFRSSPERRIRR
jgi:hypothetical protein